MDRYYQTDCLNAVVSRYRAGQNRLLVVLPTAGGKTRIFSKLPSHPRLEQDLARRRTFVLNHRDELCSQTAAAMAAANPHKTVGIEKAESQAGDADIVVLSVQTVGTENGMARLAKFNPDHARVVVIDETDLGTAKTWQDTINHFRLLKGKNNDSAALLVGFTATPNRADGVGLELLYDHIAYQEMDIPRMVKEGWLAPAEARRFTTNVDISKVSKGKDGDLSLPSLSKQINIVARNEIVLRESRPYLHLPTIGFATDVQHAQDMNELFNAHGISSACVHAKTPPKERREIFERFRTFDLRCIWQVDIATVGLDLPMATVGIFARPTLSQRWYIQAAGRFFRPYPAPEARTNHTGYRKSHAILLDFVDNSAKHKLITAPTLYGLPAGFSSKKKLHEAKDEVEQIRMKFNGSLPLQNFTSIDQLQTAQTRVDLYELPEIPPDAKKFSKFVWTPVTDNLCAIYLQSLPAVVEVQTNLLGQREVYMCSNGVRALQGTYSHPKDAFDYVASLADRTDRMFLDRAKGWRKEPPSRPQLYKLFFADPRIKTQFPSGNEFVRYAETEFSRGNAQWSKGAVSNKINSLVVTK